MNFLAAFIMRGRMQAILVASSLALLSLMLPPVSIVSSAAVALVTLRRGAFEGFYVWICSGLVAAALGLLLLGNFQIGVFFALVYVLAIWLPVWFISIALREGRLLSLAIEIAVLMGTLAVIGFYLFMDDPSAIWKAMLMQMLPAETPADIMPKINSMSHYMTGGISAGAVFSLLFGLFLGRWWQANLYNPGGFKLEYLALSIPNRLAYASMTVVLIGYLSNGIVAEIAWNITILQLVLFSVIGTSVLHTVFARHKLGAYMVPMLYVTLLLIPYAILLVALIGLIDPWLNLRKIESTRTPDGGK